MLRFVMIFSPFFCVGERLEERDAGQTQLVIETAITSRIGRTDSQRCE